MGQESFQEKHALLGLEEVQQGFHDDQDGTVQGNAPKPRIIVSNVRGDQLIVSLRTRKETFPDACDSWTIHINPLDVGPYSHSRVPVVEPTSKNKHERVFVLMPVEEVVGPTVDLLRPACDISKIVVVEFDVVSAEVCFGFAQES
ncbi:unnamed protein product [Discula destructiva]